MINFEYIKCPLHRYTFEIKPMRDFVERHSHGKVLNLFAGKTFLALDEIRNDLDPLANADYHEDALDFTQGWVGEKFNTIILDPPYSYRKSMEMYGGRKMSRFNALKNELPRILEDRGRVITFGYQTNVMGANRGFRLDTVGVFSHGGAIHDTLAAVEIKI
jgi:hypothetical protein